MPDQSNPKTLKCSTANNKHSCFLHKKGRSGDVNVAMVHSPLKPNLEQTSSKRFLVQFVDTKASTELTLGTPLNDCTTTLSNTKQLHRYMQLQTEAQTASKRP